jgi:predicted negative regulator of RcsB-dependent stress response
VDYLPLGLLALVVLGAAVLFPFMRRLKQAATAALEASKQLETHLQSLQAQQREATESPSGPAGDQGRATGDEPGT